MRHRAEAHGSKSTLGQLEAVFYDSNLGAVPPYTALPASELLAELLVTQCATLSALVQRYNDVIDHILDDDLPF